jgi:hypothetical protein
VVNELDRTMIMSKQPAIITSTRPAITLTAPYHAKADLVAAVTRQARRGEIRPLTARPRYNPDRGLWEQPVERLRPPAPAWIKPVIILGSVLISLATLGALGWWVAVTLAAAPLALFLLACLAALVAMVRAGKRQTVNITNNVTMR